MQATEKNVMMRKFQVNDIGIDYREHDRKIKVVVRFIVKTLLLDPVEVVPNSLMDLSPLLFFFLLEKFVHIC